MRTVLRPTKVSSK